NVSTISLAGTRPYSDENLDINKWKVKEVLEQEYVTRYIHDVLRSFEIRDYRIISPYVRKAGNLVHLATDFSFGFNGVTRDLWDFLDAMHPTPAVAGYPKDDAITYIKNLEPHDREYYTGFLGPIAGNEVIDLFVNLRCIKISPAFLALFIGGGITLESDPEEEWVETRWKADELLGILKDYIN
ncbi:MAG: chorismate-binding protein, partial [Bacteroidales bacterium]|nr:chorismate-binding protein [Bacteroidales bacterium]